MNMKKAFSLAEVLLTLGIIAVIAAITVPSLLKKTNEAELVSGCIKAHSTLSNAVKRMSVDYGRIGRGVDWTDSTRFIPQLMKYMNISKVCKPATNGSSGNWEDCMSLADDTKELDGDAISFSAGDFPFMTADGISYAYYSVGPDNAGYGLLDRDVPNIFGRFIVDVNGPKKPNIVGVDIFLFAVVKGKGIIPGGSGNPNQCKAANSDGLYCASYVVINKKIDYLK